MDSFFHSITTLRHSSSKIIHYVLRVSTMASYIFITHRKTKFNNLALNPQVSLKKLTVPQLGRWNRLVVCCMRRVDIWARVRLSCSPRLTASIITNTSITYASVTHSTFAYILASASVTDCSVPRSGWAIACSTGSLRWKLCSKTCLDAVWETRIDREIRSELRLVLKQMWFRKWFWSLKFIKISSMKDYANSRLKLKRTLIWAFCLHKFGDI